MTILSSPPPSCWVQPFLATIEVVIDVPTGQISFQQGWVIEFYCPPPTASLIPIVSLTLMVFVTPATSFRTEVFDGNGIPQKRFATMLESPPPMLASVEGTSTCSMEVLDTTTPFHALIGMSSIA